MPCPAVSQWGPTLDTARYIVCSSPITSRYFKFLRFFLVCSANPPLCPPLPASPLSSSLSPYFPVFLPSDLSLFFLPASFPLLSFSFLSKEDEYERVNAIAEVDILIGCPSCTVGSWSDKVGPSLLQQSGKVWLVLVAGIRLYANEENMLERGKKRVCKWRKHGEARQEMCMQLKNT